MLMGCCFGGEDYLKILAGWFRRISWWLESNTLGVGRPTRKAAHSVNSLMKNSVGISK